MNQIQRTMLLAIASSSVFAHMNAEARTYRRNIAPVISGTPGATAAVASIYRFVPTATDANGDTLGFSIANKPAWATFNTASGKLSGTPTSAAIGTYTNIRISVTDGKAVTALAPFAINVVASSSSSSSSSSQSSASSASTSSSSSASSASSSTSSSSSSVASSSSSSSTLPGTAAALGAPSATPFNGMVATLDRSARTPGHAISAVAGTMPSALISDNLPYIPNVKVLGRRDSIILYLPNVAGAADYRAYAIAKNNTTVTFSGRQPRGTVIACAGYRQHAYESSIVNGSHTRELHQAIELPGFNAADLYTIVIEAIASPCPFTGMPGHVDATITADLDGSVGSGRAYRVGNFHATIRSFDGVRTEYGNEIINGNGSLNSWANRETGTSVSTQDAQGRPVPANSTAIPRDPVILARSVIAVQMPFADEDVNAPIFDVGSNAFWDDFSSDLVVPPSSIVFNGEFHPAAYAISPEASIPGAWTFWGREIQLADTDYGANGTYLKSGFKGLQIFQRHGRLYTTFGDRIQDNPGNLQFSSLKTLPLQLDQARTKYAHSFFRLNSDASARRYWTWMICGDDSRDKLVNLSTRMPLIHPVASQFMFQPQGDNPSAKLVTTQVSSTTRYNKECLSIVQHGRAEPARSDGGERSSSRIVAQIHPAGMAKGIIALGNNFTDKPVAGDFGNLGFRYKTDATGKYLGPLIEPFDQLQPLTHFDVFLRPDRLVVFINGRQGFCVDMSTRPLTMKYGLVTYGDFIYHSALDWQEISRDPNTREQRNLHQMLLNTPIASTRVWDAIGETEMIDIPSVFTSFNPNACFKPATSAVQ